MLLREHEAPPEAPRGQGVIEMTEDSDLVQKQLSELAQQVMHVITAYNEQNDLIEEKFHSVRNVILIMESRLQTEKLRIDSEVPGVGSMVQFQQAVLQELRSGIHIRQTQDIQIVHEATDLFAGMCQELDTQSKQIPDNSLQLLGVYANSQSIPRG